MSLRKKNFQGFVIIGTDFDTNYGKEIHACFQFEFKGYEISVSTGAIKPSAGISKTFPQPILITNISTGEEEQVNGSVEDAINHVLKITK